MFFLLVGSLYNDLVASTVVQDTSMWNNSAFMGLLGVVLGTLITFIGQLIADKINTKRENRRVTYKLKIEVYSDAIRYIRMSCRCEELRKIDDEKYRQYSIICEDLYDKFFPTFSIIANRDTINEYNILRNKANNGELSKDEAFIEVQKVLKFNISDEIGN